MHTPCTPGSTTTKVPKWCSNTSVFDLVVFKISLALPFGKVLDSCKLIQKYLSRIFDAVCTSRGHRKIAASSARILLHASTVLYGENGKKPSFSGLQYSWSSCGSVSKTPYWEIVSHASMNGTRELEDLESRAWTWKHTSLILALLGSDLRLDACSL